MAWGTMGVDWETRVDYERLRNYRLGRAKEQLEKNKLGAFLCFDFNNIRYITGTTLGEWGRDKMARYTLLPRGQEPILFENMSAAIARRLYAPWMEGRVRTSRVWARGAVPQAPVLTEALGKEIYSILSDFGLEKEPLAIDICDITLLNGLRKAGFDIDQIVDAQSPMLDARLIKSQDEIMLIRTACSIVEAAYSAVTRALKPGIKENQLVGIIADTMHGLGSDLMESVNCISGPRSNPNPHIFSDRIVRPNEFVYFDIMHSYNGYRTCYYRTFFIGRPNAEQVAAYHRSRDWVYDAIKLVKPGITTADLARVWPTAQELGYKSEHEARGNAGGHGIGLSIHEKPQMSRLESLDRPFPIVENMVFCLETFAGTPDGKGGARLEEMVLVTKDGYEVLSKWPAEEMVCVEQYY